MITLQIILVRLLLSTIEHVHSILKGLICNTPMINETPIRINTRGLYEEVEKKGRVYVKLTRVRLDFTNELFSNFHKNI